MTQIWRQVSSQASVLKVVLEAGLVAVGVFLGLAGDQWRENAQHRDDARASLRRFRDEVSANRDAVLRVRDYHAEKLVAARAYLAAAPSARDQKQFGLRASSRSRSDAPRGTSHWRRSRRRTATPMLPSPSPVSTAFATPTTT